MTPVRLPWRSPNLNAHAERFVFHQGLAKEIVAPRRDAVAGPGPGGCRQRLGGTLNFYYREAA